MKNTHTSGHIIDESEKFKIKSFLSSKRRKAASKLLFNILTFIAVIVVILAVIVTFVEI